MVDADSPPGRPLPTAGGVRTEIEDMGRVVVVAIRLTE
jgi:hypothetical protein